MTNADLSGTNLTNAQLGGFGCPFACASAAILTNANLAGAVVTGAGFHATTSNGFTKEQLYSTASYQQRNLRGIGLSGNDLTGWDFSGQDLTGADFRSSTLTNANLAGAMVTGASFCCDHVGRLHQGAALLHGELPAEEFAGHWIKRQRPDRLGLQRAGSHRRGLL